jgi:glycosyltransferase involved in cell wall biosynthesis
LHLVEQIAPQVRRAIPELEILIIGRNPTAELKEKAARLPNVTVTGFVEDVRPHLERASVFAAPLRYASGTQNKVLEAMAMELPTVTTSTVADGLRMDGAEEPPVVVADDDRDFAARLVQLLENPSERSRLASLGRIYVENHFIWSRSADKLERMCLAAAGQSPATR